MSRDDEVEVFLQRIQLRLSAQRRENLDHKDTGGRTDARPLLALVGRVPVKVTDEGGPIRAGDLLTSGPTPGYAMRCTDRQACAGAIVGKALEPLQGRVSVIQALVTLQ